MGIYVNPTGRSFELAINSEIFVDKSGLIKETNKCINTLQRYMCVSRPRRFGKSMAMDMLKIEELKITQGDKIKVDLSYDKLAEEYPDSYSSIFGVVRASEDTIKQRFKL